MPLEVLCTVPLRKISDKFQGIGLFMLTFISGCIILIGLEQNNSARLLYCILLLFDI